MEGESRRPGGGVKASKGGRELCIKDKIDIREHPKNVKEGLVRVRTEMTGREQLTQAKSQRTSLCSPLRRTVPSDQSSASSDTTERSNSWTLHSVVEDSSSSMSTARDTTSGWIRQRPGRMNQKCVEVENSIEEEAGGLKGTSKITLGNEEETQRRRRKEGNSQGEDPGGGRRSQADKKVEAERAATRVSLKAREKEERTVDVGGEEERTREREPTVELVLARRSPKSDGTLESRSFPEARERIVEDNEPPDETEFIRKKGKEKVSPWRRWLMSLVSNTFRGRPRRASGERAGAGQAAGPEVCPPVARKGPERAIGGSRLRSANLENVYGLNVIVGNREKRVIKASIRMSFTELFEGINRVCSFVKWFKSSNDVRRACGLWSRAMNRLSLSLFFDL